MAEGFCKQQLVVHFQTGIYRLTANVDTDFALSYIRELACVVLEKAVSILTTSSPFFHKRLMSHF